MADQNALDLSPPDLHLTVYRGQTERFLISRRDTTGATVSLAGWSAPSARWRGQRGEGTSVPFTASIVDDKVLVVMTAAQKAGISGTGYWEVEALDPSAEPVTLGQGPMVCLSEVGSSS